MESMKSRKEGDIVKRRPGSGFLGSADPKYVRIYDYDDVCMICDDPKCGEWANCQIVEGKYAGEFLYHISECEMESLTEEDYLLLEKNKASNTGAPYYWLRTRIVEGDIQAWYCNCLAHKIFNNDCASCANGSWMVWSDYLKAESL